MLAAPLAASHTLGGRGHALQRRAPLPSRVTLCPPALRCRRLERRRPARAPAPRTSAALQLLALPALATVSKALLLGVAASWVSEGLGFGPGPAAACPAARLAARQKPARRACFFSRPRRGSALPARFPSWLPLLHCHALLAP